MVWHRNHSFYTGRALNIVSIMEIRDKELHRIVSTAIIHKDGKYLLLKRSEEKKAFPGKWTVPGGGLNVNDYINSPKSTKAGQWYNALEHSLRREVKEETGFDVGKLRYLLDLAFIRPDNIPVLVLSYYCDYLKGEVQLDTDNTDYAWANLAEAKEYDLIEGVLEEIEMVDKIIKGENPERLEHSQKI